MIKIASTGLWRHKMRVGRGSRFLDMTKHAREITS
jgi:hypothetical protein